MLPAPPAVDHNWGRQWVVRCEYKTLEWNITLYVIEMNQFYFNNESEDRNWHCWNKINAQLLEYIKMDNAINLYLKSTLMHTGNAERTFLFEDEITMNQIIFNIENFSGNFCWWIFAMKKKPLPTQLEANLWQKQRKRMLNELISQNEPFYIQLFKTLNFKIQILNHWIHSGNHIIYH